MEDNTQPVKNLAILFSDVEGSTKLYKQVGDELAKKRVFACLSAMQRIIEKSQGVVIKTIGDEIMARFDNADPAIIAAREIQQELELNNPEACGNLSVKIGINFGHAILDNKDVFGDAVNDAASMVKIAKGKQIVIPENTFTQLSKNLQQHAVVFDSIKIKASTETAQLYLVDWQTEKGLAENATIVSFDSSLEHTLSEKKLYLQYQEKHHRLTESDPGFVLGRDEASCSLGVDSQFVSRKHCWFEFRREKWVLIDHSTNGTWVQTQDGNKVFIRREELPIWGEGIIRLGENFEQDTPHEIRFVAD